MADIVTKLMPLVLIPVLLVIMLTTFSKMTDTSRKPYEVAVVNESMGTGDGTTLANYTSTYDAAADSIGTVYNGTDNTCAVTTCYNVSYTSHGSMIVTTKANQTVEVSYTAYGGPAGTSEYEGYASFEDVEDGTYDGFNLAALVPFIIVAMIVLTVIVGALGYV